MDKIITYNGETIKTKYYKEMSDQLFRELKEQYYAKPELELVKKEINNIHFKNGVKISNITNYFVKDLMAKVKLHHSKWSLEDIFNHKPLLEHFYDKTKQNDKVYPPEQPLIKNIETAFRLGGKGTASKPSNYPLKSVNYILDNYNINNNYYDFSCGWGVRLLGAMSREINYFGTDPNYLLIDRLWDLNTLYTLETNIISMCDLRAQGSEVFIPEWENKIGLAFSSPPYFFLEDYKIGNQSATSTTTYKSWTHNYLVPTFENIKKYLIKDGYVLVNINDYSVYPLFNDTFNILQDLGFTYIETVNLNNIKRTNSNGGFNDNNEGIMVFRKDI